MCHCYWEGGQPNKYTSKHQKVHRRFHGRTVATLKAVVGSVPFKSGHRLHGFQMGWLWLMVGWVDKIAEQKS